MKALAWVAGAMAAVLVVVVGLMFFLAGDDGDQLLTEAACVPAGMASLPQVADGVTLASLTPAQSKNVRTIVAVAAQVGVGRQGAIVGVATAWQESTLLNLASRANPRSMAYPNDGIARGDHDSVGIVQQRDLWGPMDVRMNVAASMRMFYEGGQAGQRGLKDVTGWESMPTWKAAQTVQVSAFPTAYARWTDRAAALVDQVLAEGGVTMPRVTTPSADCAGSVEQLTGACPASGLGIESQVTPDARNVIRCVVANLPTAFGIGGYAKRNVAGTNKPSDHSTGRAVDVMTSTGMPNAEQKAYGDKVAQYAIDNCAAFGCTYVIWAGRLWSPANGWRAYTHPGGVNTVTLGHYDHVHISVRGNAGTLLTGAPLAASQVALAA